MANTEIVIYMKKQNSFLTVLFVSSVLVACGGSEESETGLTDFQLNYGIGPVTERLDISDDLDMEMVAQGRQIFETVCIACHQLDASISGPRLRNVTENREPEFIMNFILNPGEMREKHPVGQELDEEYTINMLDMGVSREDARAIVEYLRAAARGKV